MRDLAILVPSRGRPANVGRLVAACAKTCTTDYQICWAFDDDDPALDLNKTAATLRGHGGRSYVWTGPRQGLTAWTNHMWHDLEGEFRHFASIGDDHEPLTHAWDGTMTAHLEAKGGGFAYCNNGGHTPELDWNLPEMCIVSAPILSALGWFAEPSTLHYNIDTIWRDIGDGAGCLYYFPDITLKHWNWALHPGMAELRDLTQWDAQQRGNEDVQAYHRWHEERMGADVATVRKVIEAMRVE
jgi:hypothetical protein